MASVLLLGINLTADTALSYASILITILAIIVALNVAYNFYSIHEFRNKLDDLKGSVYEDLKKFESSIESRIKPIENKLDGLQSEIDKFKEMNKVYAQLMYEVNNANAKFKYNDYFYFDAIYEELKNILHVTTHKDSFTQRKFDEIMGAKYWFIAKDLLECERGGDKYANSKNDGERNKLMTLEKDISIVYENIRSNKESIDVEAKLKPIFIVTRNLIHSLYYNLPFNKDCEEWKIVCHLAK